MCDERPTYELRRARIDFSGSNVRIISLTGLYGDDERIVNKTMISDRIFEVDFQGFTSGELVSMGLHLDKASTPRPDPPAGTDYEGGVVELSFLGPPVPGRNPAVASFVDAGGFRAWAVF